MMKTRSTKRALLTSGLALLLCVSMLIGSTFAWFTDSVTSTGNKIVAGTLDIQLLMDGDVDGTYDDISKNTSPIFGAGSIAQNNNAETLWEPGKTQVAYLAIKNNGNLALKYTVGLDVQNVSKDLYKAMEYAIVADADKDAPVTAWNGGNAVVEGTQSVSGDVSLAAGATHYFALVIHMNEEAGNEYQGGEVNFDLTILATQDTVERDSFDDQYDANAEYEKNVDVWDGTADTTWYNDTDTEFVLTTAEQLAGLAELVDDGNNFAGKTIKIAKDFDLYVEDENGEAICFDPIGSYRMDKIFEGTFNGQDHTIANMSQNTWALDNGYYYTDCGLGLFGAVENATIKNLVMDNASISGESALCGTIAAVAGDEVIFENIKVTNSKVADYQYYAGGIVGWAGGDEQFINCTIDASTTIGAQWGEFNNANGGVIGGVSTSAAILMKDCTVACRIDGFNDVTSAYEWYSYRRSGMLIGDSGQKDDPDGDNVGYAIAPNLTCENVTVIYGDWANYHYCKFNAMRYPWVRVEAGTSTGAYSNPRYGHPTDANGNEVVDENHTHNDGEAHNELIVFDQLYGGATGDRYCTYGTATHDGVTVIYNNK